MRLRPGLLHRGLRLLLIRVAVAAERAGGHGEPSSAGWPQLVDQSLDPIADLVVDRPDRRCTCGSGVGVESVHLP